MTELTKKVARRVTLFLDNRLAARDRDKITVTLHPDGTIGFRGHKCRREYRLPLVAAYKMAIPFAWLDWLFMSMAINIGDKYKLVTPTQDTFTLITLQFTASLSPTNWVNAPSGTDNPATVPVTLPIRFYRLFKP